MNFRYYAHFQSHYRDSARWTVFPSVAISHGIKISLHANGNPLWHPRQCFSLCKRLFLHFFLCYPDLNLLLYSDFHAQIRVKCLLDDRTWCNKWGAHSLVLFMPPIKYPGNKTHSGDIPTFHRKSALSLWISNESWGADLLSEVLYKIQSYNRHKIQRRL